MESPAPIAPRVNGRGLEQIPFMEARETSGITSKLVLAYAERQGGRAAVEQILGRCGLKGRETEMRDETHWFPFETKIALFEAAAEVLDDPHVTRRVGETAIELEVGAGLKAALRALGSPALLYKNVVRANAKFNAVQAMELVEVGRTFARIRFVDLAGVGFHRLDCEYNVGLLACAPKIFGLPAARIAHRKCAVDGGVDACLYEVSWEPYSGSGRALVAAGAVSVGTVATAVLAAPALMPVALGVAGAAAAGAAWTTHSRSTERRKQLELAVVEQARLSEQLTDSLQDLAGELRIDELLDKITHHARAAVGGKEFALLVEEGGAIKCRSSSGLPAATTRALEQWLGSRAHARDEPEVIDDLSEVPELRPAGDDERVPLGSLCAAPLVYRGEALGALVALATATSSFLPRDVDLLRSYAIQAAIALTNARLFWEQERRAARDPLTGLLNRRELDSTVRREIDRSERHGGSWSLALIDLDGFKDVNDARGHAEGDRALCAVAHALGSACRPSDMAFRVGGDEFALLLPETPDIDAATAGAERAREAVAALGIGVSASYGIAVWPEDGADPDALAATADRRLYGMKAGNARGELERPSSKSGADRRLAVASRLSSRLAPLRDPVAIAETTAAELGASLGWYFAAILRADDDGMIRLASATRRIMGQVGDWEQSIDEGVNGRVARTGKTALVPETRRDPDFIPPPGDIARSRSTLVVPIRVAGRIWGVIDLESTRPGAFDDHDQLLAETVAAQMGAALELGELMERLEGAFADTIAVLSDALEASDPYTAEHARAVAALCERVGCRMGLAGDELRALRYAALLHDIGKIAVPSEVLSKPGRLNEDEFAQVKQHTVIAERMLERVGYLQSSLPMIRSAHERWDGTGYPDGLAGDEIPLGARIIGACDAYHAITSERPYGTARVAVEAAAEMRRCSGEQFDGEVVETLLEDVGSPAPSGAPRS